MSGSGKLSMHAAMTSSTAPHPTTMSTKLNRRTFVLSENENVTQKEFAFRKIVKFPVDYLPLNVLLFLSLFFVVFCIPSLANLFSPASP